ncbi:ATP-binding cassette domain-containing protein [Scytonema sp. UIC 10036]|uniref:ABC transporter ATP-binding protein n=1 Tax=Scytonema sp. UIC 10036 TaxID=2304196 RepID=UPI0012DAD174|nr:ABC transporter ATP-binding protein [Scytonema sp. UIC 10036]MUG99033.1 ATP-binding cassette domain-containing protein [Scytonema sp. UIC 10036]
MKKRKYNLQPLQRLPLSFYRSDAPFKTLLLLYRHDWRKLVLAMVYYIIKYSPEWIRPVVIANIIDIISRPQEHTLGQLWLNGAILAISLVQNIPMQYLYIMTLSAVTRNMETRLRDALTRQLQQLSIGFYKQRTTGALQAKLLRDVEEIQILANHIFQFVPSAILTILVAVSVTATRAPWFLLFFVATVPTSVVLAEVLKKPIRNCNHDFRQQKEVMSSHLIEMIKLVPVTRAHGVEETEILRTQQRLNSVKKAAMRLDGINAFTGACSWVTIRLFNTLCLITAAYMAYTGKMGVTTGDVILLTGYFDTLANSILQILAVLPQIGTGFESLRSVGEILECPDLEKNQGKSIVQQVRGDFAFDNVSFSYRDRAAIDNICFKVNAGETIAIVGPSGGGKSTLLNLVIGFLRPTKGKIFLDGEDMDSLDLRTYRQFVSVVPQETILFEGTVRENILYGSVGVSEEQLRQAIVDANAYEFIAKLPQGLDTLIGENGTKLSGGQRQRLAIARALVRNPKVLILDEATASVDTASEALIQEALEHLMKNRTTFVVAHRLSTIRNADRIVVMDGGRIVEIGRHDELMEHKNGLYARLNALQTL